VNQFIKKYVNRTSWQLCTVFLTKNGYEALNLHLKENKYSNLFIIVDNNTRVIVLLVLPAHGNGFDYRNNRI
jgi:hypothetical protein